MSRNERPYTRIELMQAPPTLGGFFVEKYREGWVASDTPEPQDIYRSDGEMKDAIDWLISHGWQVLEWYDPKRGRRARAFRGELQPVRSSETIRWYRHEIGQGRIRVEDASRDLRYWY